MAGETEECPVCNEPGTVPPPRQRGPLLIGLVSAVAIFFLILTVIMIAFHGNGESASWPLGPSDSATPGARVDESDDSEPTVESEPAIATEPASSQGSPERVPLDANVGMVVIYGRYRMPVGIATVADDVQGEFFEFDYIFGTGSCFVFTDDGYLLTNRHVTQALQDIPSVLRGDGCRASLQHRRIMACFGDDRSQHYECELVEESEIGAIDYAILKVDGRFAGSLVIATNAAEAGDEVMAAGFPGVVTESVTDHEGVLKNAAARHQLNEPLTYYDQIDGSAFAVTRTKGIVSAFREVTGVEMIQTDAVIREGSSGGPLLNEEHEVIGIVALTTRGSESFNYVLPINLLRQAIAPYMK